MTNAATKTSATSEASITCLFRAEGSFVIFKFPFIEKLPCEYDWKDRPEHHVFELLLWPPITLSDCARADAVILTQADIALYSPGGIPRNETMASSSGACAE